MINSQLHILRRIDSWVFASTGCWHRGDIQVKFYKDINIPTDYIAHVIEWDGSERIDDRFIEIEVGRAIPQFNRVAEQEMLEILTNVMAKRELGLGHTIDKKNSYKVNEVVGYAHAYTE
jgi:hypothetical protein